MLVSSGHTIPLPTFSFCPQGYLRQGSFIHHGLTPKECEIKCLFTVVAGTESTASAIRPISKRARSSSERVSPVDGQTHVSPANNAEHTRQRRALLQQESIPQVHVDKLVAAPTVGTRRDEAVNLAE